MSNTSKRQTILIPTPEEDALITQQALADPDAQPLGDTELAAMVPLRALRGRPKSDHKKQLLSIRYSPEVITWFKGTGDGWQARINQVLQEYVVQQQPPKDSNEDT